MANPFDAITAEPAPPTVAEETMAQLRQNPRIETMERMVKDPGSLASVRGFKALFDWLGKTYSGDPGQQSTIYSRPTIPNTPFPNEEAPNPFVGASQLAEQAVRLPVEAASRVANAPPGEHNPGDALTAILPVIGGSTFRAAKGGFAGEGAAFRGKPAPSAPEHVAQMKQAAPAEFKAELEAVVAEMQGIQGGARAAAKGAKEAGSHPAVDRLAKVADSPQMMEAADSAAAWRLWMKHNAGEKEVGVFGAVPKKKGAKPAEGEVPIIEGTHGGKDPRKEIIPETPGRFDPKKRSAEYRKEAYDKREGAQMRLNHPPIEDLLIKEYGAGLTPQELGRRLQTAMGYPDKGPPIITGKMVTAKLKELADKGRVELLGGAGAAAGLTAESGEAEAKVAEGPEEVQGTAVSRQFENLRSQIDTVQAEAARLEKAFQKEKDPAKRRELFRDMLEASGAAQRLMETGQTRPLLGRGNIQQMNVEHEGRLKNRPRQDAPPSKGRSPGLRKGDAE